LLAVALGLAGLCIGSFLATLGARSTTGFAGLWSGRSQCPGCREILRAKDLVPVVSWLLLRGRCRYCGARLSSLYPASEAASALIGLVPALLLPPVAAVAAALLGWWLLGLALIDLHSLRLPDAMTLPLLAAGVLLSWLQPQAPAMPEPADSLMAALGSYLALTAIAFAYRRLRRREGLGMGDAKLFAAAGAWLGVMAMPWLLLGAAASGLVLAILIHRRIEGGEAVPFGVTIALTTWLLFLARQWPG
jgi:leader peptidase (prepilin peptidase)/N-methyltransferase